VRISGVLGAVIALLTLTPIAPARADISPGDLMYTDFFRWPDWRENLAHFDCTPMMYVFMWTEPPPPVVDPLTPVVDPEFTASSANSSEGDVDPLDPIGTPDVGTGGATTVPVDPIGMPGGDASGRAAAVPEPSTWSMLLLGFAGLGYAGWWAQRTTASAA
jgi:hypothetical protein